MDALGKALAMFVVALVVVGVPGWLLGFIHRTLRRVTIVGLSALLVLAALAQAEWAFALGFFGAAVVLELRTRRTARAVPQANREAAGGSLRDGDAVVLPAGERPLEVVGESHYQRALTRIAGGRTSEGHRLEAVAHLIPEPRNRHDRHAIAVVIQRRTVGYLTREDARAFGPLVQEAIAKHGRARCRALIVGGWDRGGGDTGMFGVKLHLARPGEAQATEEGVFAHCIEKLESAKGPAGRRQALAAALGKIATPELRQRLELEASKIEVRAVLDKIDGLKTPAAKRRHLTEAIAQLRSDGIADELQAKELGWLEDALRALDGEAA